MPLGNEWPIPHHRTTGHITLNQISVDAETDDACCLAGGHNSDPS
jgi:hypothetical protein